VPRFGGHAKTNRFARGLREGGRTLAGAHERDEGLGYGNKELAFAWLAELAHLAHLPPWSLRNIKSLAPEELPFAGGLVLLLAASMLWRAFPMAVTGAVLVLILQEIANPSPLFLTVPWEALEFVLSRKVRANHFWLHRTQGLLRESGDALAKIDGCATRDGFFLVGATFNEHQIQWASQSAWRAMCQTPHEGSCDRLQDDAVSACFMVNRWRLSRAEPFPGS